LKILVYKKKLIIFDLDGVLIDSKANMKYAWNSVNAKFNLKIPFARYFKNVGKPFKTILKNLGIKQSQFAVIEKEFSKKSIKYFKKIKLYKNIKNVFLILNKENVKTAVVTSKDSYRTKKILKFFKIKVDLIQCPNKKLRGKPHPDQLLKVIRKFKINKKYCTYIGDTIFDKLASDRSKIDFVLADYGYKIGIKKHKYFLKNPKEIFKLI